MPAAFLTLLLLLVTSPLCASTSHFWLFDEKDGQFKNNRRTHAMELFNQEKKIDPECHMCPRFNKTDCMFLPTEKTCFPPHIVYYAGHRCLMARVTCHASYLLIRGVNLTTGERDLWDLRMPINKSKVYHHRLPGYGEPYLARCTERGFWQLSIGVKPYEDSPVSVEKFYCTI